MRRSGLMEALAAIASAIALLADVTAASAGDARIGRASAPLCAGCHGQQGEGRVLGPDVVPSISCQHEIYLVRSMRSYKTGERKDKVMNEIFSRLSDEDIDNLAAYYAELKRCF